VVHVKVQWRTLFKHGYVTSDSTNGVGVGGGFLDHPSDCQPINKDSDSWSQSHVTVSDLQDHTVVSFVTLSVFVCDD